MTKEEKLIEKTISIESYLLMIISEKLKNPKEKVTDIADKYFNKENETLSQYTEQVENLNKKIYKDNLKNYKREVINQYRGLERVGLNIKRLTEKLEEFLEKEDLTIKEDFEKQLKELLIKFVTKNRLEKYLIDDRKIRY